MSKHYISDTSHIPFALSIIGSFVNHLQPERQADNQLLEIQQDIYLKNQSDDQDIFEQKIIEGKRVRNRKTKSSLFVENQTLKKENQILSQKNEQFRAKLQHVMISLKQKEIQLKHGEKALSELTQTLKMSQKRKSVLELDLSKMYNQLEASKIQNSRYQKQISSLHNLNRSKDTELVQLMHRHSQQIKEQKANHLLIIEQYQTKQADTKKLLKQLNGIHHQKQQKLYEERDQFKQNYQKMSQTCIQQQKSIKKLEEQILILQQYLKNNTSKYESDLISVKNQSDRVIKQLTKTKEMQINRILHDFKKEVEDKSNQLNKVQLQLKQQQTRWRSLLEDKQNSNRSLATQLHEKEKEFQKVVIFKDKDIQRLTDQIEKKITLIEEIELSNQELFSKNQTLQNSIKEVYSQTTQLESKLLETSKQKSSFATQNISLKAEVRTLQQHVSKLQNKNSTLQMQTSKNNSEIKHLKQVLDKQENQLTYYQKNMKMLETEYQKLGQVSQQYKNSNAQLKQIILQKEMNIQNLKQKYQKLQQFVQNYKMDSEKMREVTEKKWYQLRSVYENQIEQLQQKLLDSEKSCNTLKHRIQIIDRENKIYEFQNNISPNVGANSNIYYKKQTNYD